MNKSKQWTLVPLLNTTADYLEKKGIESPRLATELLLCEILKCNRLDLYLKYDRPVNSDELSAFRTSVKRAAGGEPLQYIIGHTDFMDLRIKVNPNALIPRPETEILVQESIRELESFKPREHLNVLEIGTGTGCISLALLKHDQSLRITATDISEGALSLALENAEFYKMEDSLEFVKSDMFGDLPHETAYDMIVSNPPYVSDGEYASLDEKVLKYEPRSALLAGADGLNFYRQILERAVERLNSDGVMLLEIGFDQLAPIKELAEKQGWKLKRHVRDLNDIPRVLVLYY
jgi:release factor glutamine methyltransferase